MLNFFSKYINKTLFLIIICLILGSLYTWKTLNVIVTRTVLASETKQIYDSIKRGDRSTTTELLRLRKSTLEDTIWQIEEKLTILPKSTDEYDRWLRRLNKKEKELNRVEDSLK
jgi:hypothetical protein